MSIPVNNDIRSKGTNTDTGDGFQSEFKIGCSLSFIQVELLLYEVEDCFSSSDVTGSATAHLDDIFAPRSCIKLLIEGNNSLYLTREQTEAFRYTLDYRRRNIPQQFLYILETGNQPPLFIFVFRYNSIDFFKFSLR